MSILAEKFGDKVQAVPESLQTTVYVAKEDLIPVLSELRNNEECNFALLADLTGAEYDDRFEAVYHLMRFSDCALIRVKVKLEKDDPSVPSVTGLWKAADCQERETYDLLGIKFEGHPNLKRILCPDDFEGHPLRKDFRLETRA